MSKNDFRFSAEPEPHRLRTRQILKKYPQVRNLIGKNPLTIVAIIGLVSLMIFLSWFVHDKSWWWVFGVAYLVGAFANHALFVMIHECSHNLLFKKKSSNYIAGIIANLPHVMPSAVSFFRYHIKHHSFQGIHELDADLPDYWEARLFGHNAFSKGLWLLLFPLFQVQRTFRLKEIKPIDGWIVANMVIQLAFNIAIWVLWGPKALLFMLASFFFAVGFHPVGARWIQEHYLTLDEKQETYSYYGPLNTVAFNVGYHNEHHDFPSVPWNKLPELKKTAPDYYETLKSHKSWTLLFFRFLFDKNVNLYSRVVRNERNKVALTDECKPDAEILSAKEKTTV